MEEKKGTIARTIAAFAAAALVMFVVVLAFKIKMMPKDEHFRRSCMQGAAREILKQGAAVPGDETAGGPARTWLYASFPWADSAAPAKNELMKKAWNFCDKVLEKETKNNALYAATQQTAEGSHSMPAVQLVLERLDKGWGEGDVDEQRKQILVGLQDWAVHGHDAGVQAVTEKYSREVSSDSSLADIKRIVYQGRFENRDFCKNKKAFAESKLAKDPEKFLRDIDCK